MDHGKGEVRRDAQPEVVERVGEIHGAPSYLQALVDLAELREVARQTAEDCGQAALIAERHGGSLGRAQVSEYRIHLAQRDECPPRLEVDIDGVGEPLRGLGKVPERRQRFLEARHGLPIGRPRRRESSRAPQMRHGFVPHLGLAEVKAHGEPITREIVR